MSNSDIKALGSSILFLPVPEINSVYSFELGLLLTHLSKLLHEGASCRVQSKLVQLQLRLSRVQAPVHGHVHHAEQS